MLDPAPHYRVNAALAALAFALAVLQLAIVPLLLLPHTPVLAAILIGVVALATPFNTAVLHEAIHGRLGNARWNDRLGRALGICSGVSFDIIRFGHLTHHRFNRHALDRPDVIEPGRSPIAAGIAFYAQIFGGLYLGEILGSLAMLLPRRAILWLLDRAMSADEQPIITMRLAATRRLPRRIWRMRQDVLLAIGLYAVTFYFYGAWWPLLLAGVVLRGLIVSLQDNAPHYGTSAIINAEAHNSSAPSWAMLFMLNQNLHAAHHDQPDLPWTALPAAFAGSGRGYTGRYLKQLLRQFGGPRRAIGAE